MAAENDLGRDNIKKLVIRIAVPSMLAQFVSVLYSIVDRMYIGNIPVSGDMANTYNINYLIRRLTESAPVNHHLSM